MNYFVISPSGWAVHPQDFARQLRAHWTQAAVRDVATSESSDSLEFEVRMVHSEVSGSLNRQGTSMAFIGDLRDCVRLALWFRSLAPPSTPLVLCDEGFNSSVDLGPETAEADILRGFGYSPPPAGQVSACIIARQDWVTPRMLAQQLPLQWPDAHVQEDTDPASPHSLTFRLPMRHSQLEGALERKVRSLLFQGDPRDCASLALWVRSLAPSGELLLLGEHGHLRLERGMKAEVLLPTLGASPME